MINLEKEKLSILILKLECSFLCIYTISNI